ncbi:subtilisin-like protease SBT1.8 [Gossypium australe]|uniref:Subtilisin-like protease SBT1.8 n=1 Tax=Gossypium australe TaxID=47621 RepID=A0A5B6VLI3_9ROSI|nr:subtilisin-like protease SBT1.8 [Gossypium australe]
MRYLFSFGNCVISWEATLQAKVTLLTTEAKYMAITKAVKKGLFCELISEKKTIVVYCDSQSAIRLTKEQMHHERTKHIDICYHFVREVII